MLYYYQAEVNSWHNASIASLYYMVTNITTFSISPCVHCHREKEESCLQDLIMQLEYSSTLNQSIQLEIQAATSQSPMAI